MSQIKSCPKCSAPAAAPAMADPQARVQCPVCHAEYALHEALDFHVPEFHLVQPSNGSPSPEFAHDLDLPSAESHLEHPHLHPAGELDADALHLDADWQGIDSTSHDMGEELPQAIIPNLAPLAGSLEHHDEAELRQMHRVDPHAHADEADLLGFAPEGDEVQFDFADAPAGEPEAHIPPHGEHHEGSQGLGEAAHGVGEAAFGPRGEGELAAEVGGMPPIDRAHELEIDPFASAHDEELKFQSEGQAAEHHDGLGEGPKAAHTFGEDEAFMPDDDFGVDLNLKDESVGDDAFEPVGAGAAMGGAAFAAAGSKIGKRGDASKTAPIAPRPKKEMKLGKYVVRTCVIMVALIPVAALVGIWGLKKDDMGITKWLPNILLPEEFKHAPDGTLLSKQLAQNNKPAPKASVDPYGEPSGPLTPAEVNPPAVKPVPALKPDNSALPDEQPKPEDPTKIGDDLKVPVPVPDNFDEPPVPKKPAGDPAEMKKPDVEPAATAPKPPVEPAPPKGNDPFDPGTPPAVKPAPPVEPKPESPTELKPAPKGNDPFDIGPPPGVKPVPPVEPNPTPAVEPKPETPVEPKTTTKTPDALETAPPVVKPVEPKPAVEPEPKAATPGTEPADPFNVKPEPAKPDITKPEATKPEAEPVGPRNLAKYKASDLDLAVKDANIAFATLAATDPNNRDQIRTARVSYYRALCRFAEVLPTAGTNDDTGKFVTTTMPAAVALIDKLTADRARAEELGAIGGFWFNAPARKQSKETGIALAGTLKNITQQGKVFESTLITFGKPTEIVLLSEKRPPVEDGSAVLVFATVVANPAETVAGYTGKAAEAAWVSADGWKGLSAATPDPNAKPAAPSPATDKKLPESK